jgi:hypothetical protein
LEAGFKKLSMTLKCQMDGICLKTRKSKLNSTQISLSTKDAGLWFLSMGFVTYQGPSLTEVQAFPSHTNFSSKLSNISLTSIMKFWFSRMMKIQTSLTLNWKRWKSFTFSLKTDNKSKTFWKTKKPSKWSCGKMMRSSESSRCNWKILNRIKCWKETTSKCFRAKTSFLIFRGDFLLL